MRAATLSNVTLFSGQPSYAVPASTRDHVTALPLESCRSRTSADSGVSNGDEATALDRSTGDDRRTGDDRSTGDDFSAGLDFNAGLDRRGGLDFKTGLDFST